jgi:hypothetical protein
MDAFFPIGRPFAPRAPTVQVPVIAAIVAVPTVVGTPVTAMQNIQSLDGNINHHLLRTCCTTSLRIFSTRSAIL